MDYITQFKKEITLILLGAGDSVRFCQSGLPKKQWLRIGSFPLWKYVLDRFSSMGFERIIVTANPQELEYAKGYFDGVIAGGSSRSESILKALESVESEWVMIHDVARFNPQESVIEDLLRVGSIGEADCVAPKINITDTLYHSSGTYPKREEFFAIQTPQLSKTQLLKSALAKGEFSDESSAMSAMGCKVAFTQGSMLLHKLTSPSDLHLLKHALPAPSDESFVGGGIDIHGFEEGKTMVLCGVEIESPFGFKAHSDGDVGIHSIIDALLGAIGGGDIGEWFPDADEAYLNVDSKVLLQRVMEFVKGVGYEVVNVDLTILAQTPKILPYKNKMRQSLVHLLQIPIHRINIKATTAENLGFIGRKEGVSVLSNVSLKFRKWDKE